MRRANGTGTIIKLSGNRRNPYAVRIAGRDRHGYVIQKYLSYHRTAAEAQAALDEWNSQKVKPSQFPTLSEVHNQWEKVFAIKKAKLAKSTVTAYNNGWSKLAPLYEKKMIDIRTDDWQAIINDLYENGSSSSTVKLAVLMMHTLSKFAAQRDIIQKDYSQYIEMPKIPPKYEKGVLNSLQIRRIKELAKEGYPYADAVLILVYTGMRANEFASLTRFHLHNAGDVWYFQHGSKTEAGKDRIIPIHPYILPLVFARFEKSDRLLDCTQANFGLRFASLMNEIGLPQATPHWCRHTFATLADKAEIPENVKKQILGHRTQDVTEHYTHRDIQTLYDWVLKIA